MFAVINKELAVEKLQNLRIPFEHPNCPPDWKDWYHYILIDPERGIRILVNISLSSRPENGEIQISLVIQIPGKSFNCETYAEVRSVPWGKEMVNRFPPAIHTSSSSLQIKNGFNKVSLQGKNSAILLEFEATPKAIPYHIEEQAPFGSGFIGWGFIPGMEVNGYLDVCGTPYKITPDWFCYHDRNFGRFRWGEDIGWEWLVATFRDSGGISWQVVFDRRTNKDHTCYGFEYIFIFLENKLKKVFVGGSLKITWNRKKTAHTPLRLPGNMASVFADRISAQIESVKINARDDRDHISIILHTGNAFELIVPDYEHRQFTVMEEISGKAEMQGELNGNNIATKGDFYAEYVR